MSNTDAIHILLNSLEKTATQPQSRIILAIRNLISRIEVDMHHSKDIFDGNSDNDSADSMDSFVVSDNAAIEYEDSSEGEPSGKPGMQSVSSVWILRRYTIAYVAETERYPTRSRKRANRQASVTSEDESKGQLHHNA